MWPADKNLKENHAKNVTRYLFKRLDKASWIGCEARVSRLGLRTKATASSTVGVNKGNVDTSPVLCGMGITCKLPPWMYTWGKKEEEQKHMKERKSQTWRKRKKCHKQCTYTISKTSNANTKSTENTKTDDPYIFPNSLMNSLSWLTGRKTQNYLITLSWYENISIQQKQSSCTFKRSHFSYLFKAMFSFHCYQCIATKWNLEIQHQLVTMMVTKWLWFIEVGNLTHK